MPILLQTFLLFTLNLVDALLTVYWVRHGFATEGNGLMASLLDMGNVPFLTVKMAIGALAAAVLWRWGNLRTARIGLTAALAVYIALMGVHLFTGLSACGLVSENMINNFSIWTQRCFALFI
jgi:Domain of unknown function (DUF5658)